MAWLSHINNGKAFKYLVFIGWLHASLLINGTFAGSDNYNHRYIKAVNVALKIQGEAVRVTFISPISLLFVWVASTTSFQLD